MRSPTGLWPLLLLAGCGHWSAARALSSGPPAHLQMAGKRAIVYTTADSTTNHCATANTNPWSYWNTNANANHHDYTHCYANANQHPSS